jgi:hypothetical protein
MITSEYTEFLKSWLPWITMGGIVWRAFSKARLSITSWADQLLDNHAKHIQEALDKQSETLQAIQNQQDLQIDLLSRIAEK